MLQIFYDKTGHSFINRIPLKSPEIKSLNKFIKLLEKNGYRETQFIS